MLLKQSTAAKIPFFMADSTDSITGKTGLSPTVTLSKDGAAFGAAGGSVTEIGNGWYYLSANTTDTGTLASLLLHATGTGADPWDESHQVTLGLPGDTLSAASVQAIWDALTSALTTSGSIGKKIVDNLNATISSVVALLPTALVGGKMDSTVTGAVGSVTGSVGSVTGNVGGNVTGSVGSVVGAVGSVTGAVGSVTGLTPGNLDVAVSTRLASGSYTSPPSAASIATAVWDALTSALTTTGSIGKWIVDKLDVLVSSRMETFVYTAPDNTGITAIKVKTDQLGFTAGNVDANAQVVSDKTGYILAASTIPIKKNTALAGFTFPMYDSGGALATGLTVTARRSIDGAAVASCSNAVSEVSLGLYKIDFSAADLNGNSIAFIMSATGAISTTFTVNPQ